YTDINVNSMLSHLFIRDFTNSLLKHFLGSWFYRGPAHFKAEARLGDPADSLAAINDDLSRIIAERDGRAYFRAVRGIRVVSSVLYRGACRLSAVNSCPHDPQHCRSAFWRSEERRVGK